MVQIRVTRETWSPLVGAALATFGVTHKPPVLNHALHTFCDALEQLWINARPAKRARPRFFEHIRTIIAYLVFPNWTTLMQILIDSRPPPHLEAQLTR